MKTSIKCSTEEWIELYQKKLEQIKEWNKENYCYLPSVIQGAISSGMVRYQELINELEKRRVKYDRKSNGN